MAGSYVPKLDTEEIGELLDIIHHTINLPSLSPLNQAAMARLVEIAQEVGKALEEAKAKKAEEEAEAKAKAEAKYKEEEKEDA